MSELPGALDIDLANLEPLHVGGMIAVRKEGANLHLVY
jgi:hypothetical protein